MTYERKSSSGANITVQNEVVVFEDQNVEDSVRSVYNFDEGIPVREIPECISHIMPKLHELENTNFSDYYHELMEAQVALSDVPIKIDDFDKVINEFDKELESSNVRESTVRGSVLEKYGSDATEEQIREETGRLIESLNQFKQRYEL